MQPAIDQSSTMPRDNAEQKAYWNGEAGLRWTRRQEMQDAILAPISNIVIDRAAVAACESVIDIGCGCGATSIVLAKQVGEAGRVLGVDISTPMLARARERTSDCGQLSFAEADATEYPFEPGRTDLLFSRFGVMFFADPPVSFANMRLALRTGGRLVFVCWREPKLNPWLIAPLQAAYKHVPRLPEMSPDAPGPFAFASQARVRDILASAGFADICLEPCDLKLDLAAGHGLDMAVDTALSIGPASRALDGQPSERRAAAVETIRETLAAVQIGQTVPLDAAVWIVTARNS